MWIVLFSQGLSDDYHQFSLDWYRYCIVLKWLMIILKCGSNKLTRQKTKKSSKLQNEVTNNVPYYNTILHQYNTSVQYHVLLYYIAVYYRYISLYIYRYISLTTTFYISQQYEHVITYSYIQHVQNNTHYTLHSTVTDIRYHKLNIWNLRVE